MTINFNTCTELILPQLDWLNVLPVTVTASTTSSLLNSCDLADTKQFLILIPHSRAKMCAAWSRSVRPYYKLRFAAGEYIWQNGESYRALHRII